MGTIGAGSNAATANATFYVVNVRTWFDPRTISEHRGNRPLEPSPREVFLVDEAGQEYPIFTAGQEALEKAGQAATRLTDPLHPGKSYISRIVFDVPASAHNLRLLIMSPTNPHWIGSLLHKKIFLRLPT